MLDANTWSALLHPNKIVVKRDDRQRRELTGIEELADSILRRGQLQPIVIQRDTNILIAGERRLTAIKLLMEKHPERHFHVKVVYSDEIDEGELQALELEENVKRIDLPWQDNCRAILRYHEYRSASEVTWSIAKTAAALGIDGSEIGKRLEVARELLKGNKLVTEAPRISTAKNIVQRQGERKAAAETSELLSMVSTKPSSAVTKVAEVPVTTGTGYILNLDFLDWASTYTGPKFNLIHCDFPYGVGMHKSDQGSGASYGTYEDTPEIYWALVKGLLDHGDRFIEDSAHLLFWFSMDYYEETRIRLASTTRSDGSVQANPWKVNPFPLIWHKTDGRGILPDPKRGPRRIYETAFLASRGDRPIVRSTGNAVGSPIQPGRHMSEKPQTVLGHFFRMLVDEHSSVLDPTCGSGSAIRAAVTAGASRYLGIELNKEFADHADESLRQHLDNPQVELEDLVKDAEQNPAGGSPENGNGDIENPT